LFCFLGIRQPNNFFFSGGFEPAVQFGRLPLLTIMGVTAGEPGAKPATIFPVSFCFKPAKKNMGQMNGTSKLAQRL
jgi:hypothetical protein